MLQFISDYIKIKFYQINHSIKKILKWEYIKLCDLN